MTEREIIQQRNARIQAAFIAFCEGRFEADVLDKLHAMARAEAAQRIALECPRENESWS